MCPDWWSGLHLAGVRLQLHCQGLHLRRRLPRDAVQLRAERAGRDDAAVRRRVRPGHHVLRHGALTDAVSLWMEPTGWPTMLITGSVPSSAFMPFITAKRS